MKLLLRKSSLLLIAIAGGLGVWGFATLTDNEWWSYAGIFICFCICMTAGAIAKMQLAGYRPFEESEWRKAKRTYERDDK